MMEMEQKLSVMDQQVRTNTIYVYVHTYYIIPSSVEIWPNFNDAKRSGFNNTHEL